MLRLKVGLQNVFQSQTESHCFLILRKLRTYAIVVVSVAATVKNH